MVLGSAGKLFSDFLIPSAAHCIMKWLQAAELFIHNRVHLQKWIGLFSSFADSRNEASKGWLTNGVGAEVGVALGTTIQS